MLGNDSKGCQLGERLQLAGRSARIAVRYEQRIKQPPLCDLGDFLIMPNVQPALGRAVGIAPGGLMMTCS
ncbi:hypothetical protein D3C84_1109800 [compost metagenome]